MRTGILSDESILQNCAEYNPVPLGKVRQILDSQVEAKHGLDLKAQKYVQAPPRPVTFQAMSNSLANQVDPTNPIPFRQNLAVTYNNELEDEPTSADMNYFGVEPSEPTMQQYQGMTDVFQVLGWQQAESPAYNTRSATRAREQSGREVRQRPLPTPPNPLTVNIGNNTQLQANREFPFQGLTYTAQTAGGRAAGAA